MKAIIAFFQKFIRRKDGLTVLEYVVAAGVLAGVIALVFTDWGNLLKNALAAVNL